MLILAARSACASCAFWAWVRSAGAAGRPNAAATAGADGYAALVTAASRSPGGRPRLCRLSSLSRSASPVNWDAAP